MEIILLERIEKLGAIGDVVTVKDGYARNFLLPNKKALRANDANRKVFEANRARIEADNAERRGEAEKARRRTSRAAEVVLIRASSNSGQLYGSVIVRDIVDALNAEGHDVDKSMIVLERPIKTIGVFDVRVALHPEVSVDGQGQRRPLGRRGRAAGAGRRRDGRRCSSSDTAGFTEAFDPNAEPGEIPADMLEAGRGRRQPPPERRAPCLKLHDEAAPSRLGRRAFAAPLFNCASIARR